VNVRVAPAQPAPRAPTPAETRTFLGKLGGEFKQAHTLASSKKWDALAKHAQSKLLRLKLPAEARQTIEALPAEGRRLDALTKVEAQLAAGKSLHLSEAEVRTLPSPVKKAVDEVTSMERLQAALTGKWGQKPDVAQLEQDLAAFAAVTKDAALTARLQGALASRAARAGHPEVAQKLLPPSPKARDITKVAPGENSGTGKQPPKSDFRGVTPEPPQGTHAAQKQSAREGLPPLKEKVAGAAKQARRRATATVRDQMDVASHHLHLYQHRLLQYSQNATRLSQEKDEDRKKEAGRPEKLDEMLARILKRKLTAQDRILLQGMLNKGMKRAEIAAQFRELEALDAK
jgi:hypothetical protein